MRDWLMWKPAPWGRPLGLRNTQDAFRRQETRRRAWRERGEATAAASHILPSHSRENEHEGGDAGDDQRGAEVGLADDEGDEEEGDGSGDEEGVLPIFHLVEAFGEEPGEEEDGTSLESSEGWKVKKLPKRIQRWVLCEWGKK